MDYTYALEKRLEWLRWLKQPDTLASWQEELPGGMESLEVYEQILESGDTYFMNQNFCQLVDTARQTIPDQLKFEPDWMISPSGFLWCEEPFVIPKPAYAEGKDVKVFDRINQMKISAIGWRKIPDWYIVKTKSKGFVMKALGEEMKPGSYQFVCFLNWRDINPKADFGFGMWSYFVLNPGQVVIDRIHLFEKNSIDCDQAASYLEGRSTDMLHEIRWIYAAMHLMAQKLAAKETTQPPRSTRRRMQKAGAPFVPLVKVITLRRKEPKKNAGPGSEVDWQWQWQVRTHGRWQYYPSTGEHKYITIEEYIKGPEDKPLKPPQVRIFKAER